MLLNLGAPPTTPEGSLRAHAGIIAAAEGGAFVEGAAGLRFKLFQSLEKIDGLSWSCLGTAALPLATAATRCMGNLAKAGGGITLHGPASGRVPFLLDGAASCS